MSSSRRDFFRSVLGRRKEVAEPGRDPGQRESVAGGGSEPDPVEDGGEVALILDRFCLAHQGSFCSVCVEQCPEMGAIVTAQGKPSVVPEWGTGGRGCQMVGPAPKNAIFTVAAKPKKGRSGRWEENRVDLDEQLGSEPDADADS